MILYNPKNWRKLIFHLTKSDTIVILWKQLALIFLFTLGLAFVEINFFPKANFLKELFKVYQILGFVISLLLVFRTNTAYDRWWEGRKKLGDLTNDIRNLSVKLGSLNLSSEDRAFFARHISNFPFILKDHLREGINLDQLDYTEDEKIRLKQFQHIPSGAALLLEERIQRLLKQQEISEEFYIAIYKQLNGFLDTTGACERIQNTPIPFSYSMFFKKFIVVYVTTLPLALVLDFGFWAAFIATFIFYVFVSIEVLAEEIEDPLGDDDNDLPLDEIAERLNTQVRQLLK